MARFVAIDGESLTEGSEHNYVLLASSEDSFIYSRDGLATHECFRFLLDLKVKNPKSTFVAFGLNYDVNMMLRDISKKKLQELWANKSLVWRNYKISWIPSKWFSIKKDKTVVRIYDVFGFFQQSFVNALKNWDLEPGHAMEEMKESRDTFKEEDSDQIIDYSISECKCLVELMQNLDRALNDVDLKVSRWIGAGAIASSLMSKEGVKQHHVHDRDFPVKCAEPIFHAYFGGRVEVFKSGEFSDVWDYDVCSAYPSIALNLPSLKGKWDFVKEFDPSQRFALWRVSWDVGSNAIVCPFPFRIKKDIYYPYKGEGWYHASEIKVALKHFPGKIKVKEGRIFTPYDGTDKPFDFIRKVYSERKKLKAKGHPSQKVLKLGLNSLYGKLAQGIGFRGQDPPYQSFMWAGMITAGTRAKLLDLAMQNQDDLIMIATDGIFFKSEQDVELSDNLGGWEVTKMQDMFVAQPGVYSAFIDGKEYKRSRGFFAKEIDFDKIREGYKKEGPFYVASYPSKRFVGLGTALKMTDFSKWAKFHKSTRKLSLYPARKHIDDENIVPGEIVTHKCCSAPDGVLSEMYTPKDGKFQWLEEALDFLQGTEQPLKDF